jgi:hypothetical protein
LQSPFVLFLFIGDHDCDTVLTWSTGVPVMPWLKFSPDGRMEATDWLLFASVCRFGVFQLNFQMEQEAVVQWTPTSFSNRLLVGSEMGKVLIPWFRHQIINAFHPFQQQIQHGAFPLGWVSLSCILWVGCLNLDLLSGVKLMRRE